MAHDCIMVILEELRQARPPQFQADEFETWRISIARFIADLPTQPERWSAITFVASDLTKADPSMSALSAMLSVTEWVLEETGGRR